MSEYQHYEFLAVDADPAAGDHRLLHPAWLHAVSGAPRPGRWTSLGADPT